METVVFAVNLAINLWLLIILQRQRVRMRLPWFVYYVAWVVITGLLQLVLALKGHRLLVLLYWWMEAVEIFLIVAAVRESFFRIFRGFTKMRWFRWTVSGLITAVLGYSAWKALYHPPVQISRLATFVLVAESVFRWGILGIALLTTVLSAAVSEPMDTREDAVVTGFGVASFGFLIYVVSRWFFGLKYISLTKYASSVGYFGAAFWWIWVFSRPVEGVGFEELGIGPEEMLRTIRQYRQSIKRIRGKE